MSDILMTNVFFAITAISSIFTTILLTIALILLIKILKRGKRVVNIISEETHKIIDDVDFVRSSVKKHTRSIKEFATAAFIKKTIDLFLQNKQDKK